MAFKCFQISVSTPFNSLLRDSILLAKLKQRLPSLIDHFNTIATIKDVWRHLAIEAIMSKFNAAYNGEPCFQINIVLDHKEAAEEFSFLCQKYPHLFHPNRKSKKLSEDDLSHLNHSSIGRIIETLGDDGLKDLSIKIPSKAFHLDKLECFFHPMYIVGRYNKFSRCLSQTPWYIDGEKKMATSVQEIIIEEINKVIPCESRFEQLFDNIR